MKIHLQEGIDLVFILVLKTVLDLFKSSTWLLLEMLFNVFREIRWISRAAEFWSGVIRG